MNEVVVDRGLSPYLTNLEFYCNGRLMTSVQGDGKQIYKQTFPPNSPSLMGTLFLRGQRGLVVGA